jgi:hypothetical protein
LEFRALRLTFELEGNAMARTILDILGTMLVVVGIAGFVSPALGGTHLSSAHNFIHILTGALALWFGLRGSQCQARRFSLALAVLYGGLAFAGFAFGRPQGGISDQPSDPRLLTLVPNMLELGQADHVLNVAIGVVFLSAAVMARDSLEDSDAHRRTA